MIEIVKVLLLDRLWGCFEKTFFYYIRLKIIELSKVVEKKTWRSIKIYIFKNSWFGIVPISIEIYLLDLLQGLKYDKEFVMAQKAH